MSNAREAQSGTPPPSPEQQRVARVATTPSTRPQSSQALAHEVNRAVALAVDAKSPSQSPSLPPRRPSVPVLPAIPQRDSTAQTPLLSVQQPTPRRSVQDDSGLQRVAPGGLPKSRVAAQYLDLAAAVTSTPVPGTALNAVRGFASGALWSTSAGFSAYNNQQDVRARHAQGEGTGATGVLNRVADASSFVAGASDATSSVFSAFGTSPGWAATASTATAYASNAFWGVAGAIGTGQGVYNLFQSGKSKVASGLQVAGGLLNIAGAGFGAVAAQRQSADANDPTAAYYGYASAAAWTLGSVATIASNHLARRAENTRFAHDVENTG